MKSFNQLFIFTFISFSVLSFRVQAAAPYSPATFALECIGSAQAINHMPLGVFEFSEDLENAKILPNYLDLAFEMAPITFKNLKKEIQQAKLQEATIVLPNYDNYDSIAIPPKECKVLSLAVSIDNFKTVIVNDKYWSKFPQDVKNYLIFELLVRKYLAQDLASSDYRRFALYIATGKFRELSTEYQMAFLKYHGIKEYNQSGVSVNLDKELIFYEDTQNLKAAYPFLNATFENATLNPEKFVTFFNAGRVSGASTTTPFTRVINGQTFSFITPADENPPLTDDKRYYPRTDFFPNGDVKRGLILPIDQLFHLVTNIKKPFGGGKKTFKIDFYKNLTPSFYSGNPGSIMLFNTSYQTTFVNWWENGNVKEVGFTKRYPFNIPNVGQKDILYLLLNEDGSIDSYAL